MEKYITKDGSTTFYNTNVLDHYHTKAGAKQEAFEKHVKALVITSVKNPIIFDICFGLGYNSAAALDTIREATIYCFENDREILEKVLDLNEKFRSYPIIKKFVKNFLENNQTVYEENKIKLIMVFGDARKEIKNVKEKANFVFFAPFSPEKVPDMWTKEFFADINSQMKDKGRLSTYSYARSVKDNLKSAGFELMDGPILHRRSPSLIAIKHNI